MREIKFRVFSKTDGEYIGNYDDGSYCAVEIDSSGPQSFRYKTLGCTCDPGCPCGGCVDILNTEDITDNHVVEQFTGLKDENGSDIYDGDIVSENRGIGENRVEVRQVEFDMGGYAPFAYDGGGEFYHESCQVIGNIHENPELLKE